MALHMNSSTELYGLISSMGTHSEHNRKRALELVKELDDTIKYLLRISDEIGKERDALRDQLENSESNIDVDELIATTSELEAEVKASHEKVMRILDTHAERLDEIERQADPATVARIIREILTDAATNARRLEGAAELRQIENRFVGPNATSSQRSQEGR